MVEARGLRGFFFGIVLRTNLVAIILVYRAARVACIFHVGLVSSQVIRESVFHVFVVAALYGGVKFEAAGHVASLAPVFRATLVILITFRFPHNILQKNFCSKNYKSFTTKLLLLVGRGYRVT